MKLTPLDPWICHKINAKQPGVAGRASVLTRQEIDAWQLQKLNETLSLARGKSSFYRNHLQGMPESISSLDELHKLPFTTPEDIRANPLHFVCVSQDEIQRVVTLQSSGTTGEPKRIYFTAEDQELTIDFFGVGMSTFTEPNDKVLILLPGETPGSVGDLLRLGLQRLRREPVPYGPVRDSLHALNVIQSLQIDCLVGSPTQVLGLARRAQTGMHTPRSVLLSTDYVPASIVDILEQVWGCQVYNHYGATEMGLGAAVECAAHRGYHLREADLYFEVVDPVTGEPVPDGKYGELVFTTLTRRGMPLIRYRMGDKSRFIPGDCPCGTKLRTLEKVRGRFNGFSIVANELLKLPDKDGHRPDALLGCSPHFDEALFPIPGLLNFSVAITGDPVRFPGYPCGNETVTIEAQMLTDTDATKLVEQALKTIPALKDLKVIIHCQHNPKEVGSLSKRVIIDKRGQNA